MIYPDDFKQDHVARFLASGLCKADYEQQNRINPATFRRWLRKYAPDHVVLVGRRRKYTYILDQLDLMELYTPSLIAAFAEAHGLLKCSDPEERRKEKQRIRLAMARLSDYHQFLLVVDGVISLPGQAPFAGWFGWRWQGRESYEA